MDEASEKKSPTCEENADKADKDPQAQAAKMRDFVLGELVETEESYVQDMAKIVDGYMAAITSGEVALPEELKGNERVVFANAAQIYEWHRDFFLNQLKECTKDASRLPGLFLKYERRFHMYVIYCTNKPKSELLVQEFDAFFDEMRTRFKHRLKLADLLIKPVQRMMKYQLLLKDFLKYTVRAGLDSTVAKRAVDSNGVCTLANDSMEVGRLSGFDGKINTQGKLILQGTYQATDAMDEQLATNDERLVFKTRRIFVFEQIIIFAEVQTLGKNASEFDRPHYLYKAHIQVNKLTVPENSHPTRFLLKLRDPQIGEKYFIIEAESQETKALWVSKLKAMLDTQMNFLRALQSPIDFQKRMSEQAS